jgi:hypothetical protein
VAAEVEGLAVVHQVVDLAGGGFGGGVWPEADLWWRIWQAGKIALTEIPQEGT